MRNNKISTKLDKMMKLAGGAFVILLVGIFASCNQKSSDRKAADSTSEEILTYGTEAIERGLGNGVLLVEDYEEVSENTSELDDIYPPILGVVEESKIPKEDMQAMERDYFYNLLSNKEKEHFRHMYASMLTDPYAIIKLDSIDWDVNRAIEAYTNSSFFFSFGNSWSVDDQFCYKGATYVTFSFVEGTDLDVYRADLDRVVSGALEYDDFYSRCKYVYDFCLENYSYDKENIEDLTNHVASGVGDKAAVCQTFACFCNVAFSKLGIQSVYVTSEVVNGEAHAWDLIYNPKTKLWYHFDVTSSLEGDQYHSWLLTGTILSNHLDEEGFHNILNWFAWLHPNFEISEYVFNPDEDNYLIVEYL